MKIGQTMRNDADDRDDRCYDESLGRCVYGRRWAEKSAPEAWEGGGEGGRGGGRKRGCPDEISSTGCKNFAIVISEISPTPLLPLPPSIQC